VVQKLAGNLFVSGEISPALLLVRPWRRPLAHGGPLEDARVCTQLAAGDGSAGTRGQPLSHHRRNRAEAEQIFRRHSAGPTAHGARNRAHGNTRSSEQVSVCVPSLALDRVRPPSPRRLHLSFFCSSRRSLFRPLASPLRKWRRPPPPRPGGRAQWMQ
jgi:hypothetical protein